jgi:pimeloyl-ACP methyl ester carboxylesterase
LAQSSNARHRHRLRRGVLAALVVVLAATLFTVPSATASPPPASGTGSAAVPQLDWASCAGEGLDAFECATAVVPLDYDKPRGKQITLALTRLPAGDPSRKIGSLFINPGGPGGSGVEFVQGAGPFLYSDAVRARFDLVGFDPRGIIGSTPLRCY